MVRSSFSASSFEVYPERYAHIWEGDYAKGRRERPLSANNPGLRYAPLLDADSSHTILPDISAPRADRLIA
jgi:hypothetical protein